MAEIIDWMVSNATIIFLSGIILHIASSILIRAYVRKSFPDYDRAQIPELRRLGMTAPDGD